MVTSVRTCVQEIRKQTNENLFKKYDLVPLLRTLKIWGRYIIVTPGKLLCELRKGLNPN